MTNIFLEKSYTRCGGETIPKLYSKNSKSSKSQDQFYKSFIQFVFIVCKFGSYRNILKLNSRPLVFTSWKAFPRTKRDLDLISLPHLMHVFRRQIFLSLCCINWPNFLVFLFLLCEIMGNMCIEIVS